MYQELTHEIFGEQILAPKFFSSNHENCACGICHLTIFLFFSNAIERIAKLITGNLGFCAKASWSKKNGIVFKLEMSFAWIIINLLPPTCFYSPHPIQTGCVTSKQQNLTGKILSKLVQTCLKFSHVQIGINLSNIVQIGPIYSFTLLI